MRKTFMIPDIEEALGTNHNSDKIIVIAVLGKSAFATKGSKIACIDHILPFDDKIHKNNEECFIEGFYDEMNQIVYLHLNSMLDTNIFVEHYDKLTEKMASLGNSDDFLTVYDEIKSKFARALLLLFYISHLVILVHPNSTFDVNYVQYFKAADGLRQKLNSSFSNALKEVEGLSSETISAGRFCTPRLIFYFEREPKHVTNLKKTEHNMEDRIYHVLKKTRIITPSSYSLFAIPLNEEFVYISSGSRVNNLGHAVQGLIQSCQPRGSVNLQFPFCTESSSERDFTKFLKVHINQARSSGFEDNVTSSRQCQQQPFHFELPTLKHWIEVCKVLHNIIIQPQLIKSLCVDTRFSEQRCKKVLPLALARYQEALPNHYTRATHEARLASAMTLFGVQARGPVFNQYCTQLEAECLAYWETGRQLCEAASLTGNPCTLPKHPPEQEHCSGVLYIAACDCGRKQASREDPYTPKQANYTFYQQLSKDCVCSSLERITFQVFQPSSKEFRAATLTDCEEPLSVLSDRSTELTPDPERALVKQPSTTEYLPGMLTLNSPPGILPYYSSWSLVCLGASSLYSHNVGLLDTHYPGFLSGTNYLLPWDVTVATKTKQAWQQSNKHSTRGRRTRTCNTTPQITVKVFIGVEYECPRGHRFMLAAPDRILRLNSSSMVKDTGHKIAESDMPLYFPCPCRSSKPLTAQLMRLHVVTPKAPVHCTLNPRVQPAATAPIFVTSLGDPASLTQSAYWILRLPYIYATDKENFREHHSARLLQGCFSVVSESS